MSVIRQYSLSKTTFTLTCLLLLGVAFSTVPAQSQGTKPATKKTNSTPKTETATKPGATKTVDPWFMLSDFSAVLIVRPADLVKSELVKTVPIDRLTRDQNLPDVSAEKLKLVELVVIGVQPDNDLSSLMLAGPNPATLKPLAFVRAVSPIKDIPAFIQQLSVSEVELEKVTKEGKTWWLGEGGRLTVVKLDDRTIGMCFGDSDAQRKILIDNKRVTGPLTQRSSQIDASAEFALLVALDRHQASLDTIYAKLDEDAAPQAQQYIPIAKNVNGVDIQISLTGKTLLKVDVDARESTAAPALKITADQGVAGLKQVFAQFKQTEGSQSPDAKPLIDFADNLLASISVTQANIRTTIEVKQPASWQPIVDALKPMIKNAQAAAERAKRVNALKQLALGLHNYYESNQSFPPAAGAQSGFYDAKGIRIHGWRTHLLPYLDQLELYNQLDPKAPWTSPKNKPFAAVTPEYYISDGVDKSTGKTRFVTLTGPQTLWPEKPLRFPEVTDGLSNTILFIEVPVDKAVAWTSTHDIPFDPKRPLDGIGKIPPEGLLVAMGDGSVQLLRPDITAEVFKALVTPQGGEVIDRGEAFMPR